MGEGDWPKVDSDVLFASEANYQTGNFIQVKAGENITAGDLVYIKASDGLLWIADKDDSSVSGININTVTTGNTATVQTAGKYTTTGLTADTVYYLGDAGALTTSSNNYKVGVATSTTVLYIDIVVSSSTAGGSPIYIIPVDEEIDVVQGTFAWAIVNTDYGNGLLNNSTMAQNDEFTIPVYLMAGTWTVHMITMNDSNNGIITVSDDVDGTYGTIDTYFAGQQRNTHGSITGITISESGLKTVSFKVATKNGSSSAYDMDINQIVFERTA